MADTQQENDFGNSSESENESCDESSQPEQCFQSQQQLQQLQQVQHCHRALVSCVPKTFCAGKKALCVCGRTLSEMSRAQTFQLKYEISAILSNNPGMAS